MSLLHYLPHCNQQIHQSSSSSSDKENTSRSKSSIAVSVSTKKTKISKRIKSSNTKYNNNISSESDRYVTTSTKHQREYPKKVYNNTNNNNTTTKKKKRLPYSIQIDDSIPNKRKQLVAASSHGTYSTDTTTSSSIATLHSTSEDPAVNELNQDYGWTGSVEF